MTDQARGAGHTKGPWLYGASYGNDSVRIETPDGKIIGAIRNQRMIGQEQGRPVYEWDDEGDANARLIAAAPDLLAALEAAQDAIEADLHDGPTLRQIKAAIAKAKAKGEA